MAEALEHAWLAGPSSQRSDSQGAAALGGDSVWEIESFDESYRFGQDSEMDIGGGESLQSGDTRWTRPSTISGTNMESQVYGSDESFSQPMGLLHLGHDGYGDDESMLAGMHVPTPVDSVRGGGVGGAGGGMKSGDTSINQTGDEGTGEGYGNGEGIVPHPLKLDLDTTKRTAAQGANGTESNDSVDMALPTPPPTEPGPLKRKAGGRRLDLFSSGSLSDPPDIDEDKDEDEDMLSTPKRKSTRGQSTPCRGPPRSVPARTGARGGATTRANANGANGANAWETEEEDVGRVPALRRSTRPRKSARLS